ncbi:MAG TPA: ABC transporter permease [Candidatus Acidoferrales bacterium]|nr:ABC transporter permease [Candidatus Acidoferrales bacterium]
MRPENWRYTIPLRWRTLFGRRKADEELSEEIRFHVERKTEELAAGGMPPEAARRAALVELGGAEQAMERCRDQRKLNWVQDFLQDLRYGLRLLRKSPGFTAVAVATVALGIGANTAIFSVVNAVLLRPLPYPHADRLVRVFDAKPQEGIPETGTSYVDFAAWRDQNHVFSTMAAAQAHDLTLSGRGEPLAVHTAVVTPDLFSVLQVTPLAGRAFVAEDGKKGATPVVILSENFWRSRFGGDRRVIGQTIELDKRAFTVVGIMPEYVRYPLQTPSEDVWVPLAQDPLFGPWMARPGGHWVSVVARLNPGVGPTQAQAEMAAIQARLGKQHPEQDAGWTVRIVPLDEVLVGDVKGALLILLGAVGLVLLIACANLANLLLARATSRAREIGVRTALGAGRTRIVRQLLTESAALGMLGGAAGILLAWWGVRGLRSLLPPDLPAIHPVQVDGWVLAFGLALSVAASFVFGLAPALFASGSRVQPNLREGAGRAGESGGRKRARRLLAAAEIALAMVLLAGAGLLIRSFQALVSVNPGFDARHLVKADSQLPQYQYSTPQQWVAFSDGLLARVRAEPGLRDTAVAVPLPLVSGFVNLGFTVVGNPPLPPGTVIDADYAAVSPEYFRVMGIPLLRGRWFNRQDSPSAPKVAIISDAMARQYFPKGNELGRHMHFGFPPNGDTDREIVGVVGDVRDQDLRQAPGPMMYVPFDQAPFWGAELVTRSGLDPASIAGAIRRDVATIDKDLPVADVTSMSAAISDSVAQPRFRTLILGMFGAMALLLAAVGIFGVISYSVSCRTHELGLRMALGATQASLLRLVLGESARLVLAGLAVGIPAALALTRFLATLLYGVRPADPATFIGVAILLVVAALAACSAPARRAMRVDPMTALRHE